MHTGDRRFWRFKKYLFFIEVKLLHEFAIGIIIIPNPGTLAVDILALGDSFSADVGSIRPDNGLFASTINFGLVALINIVNNIVFLFDGLLSQASVQTGKAGDKG